MIHFFPASLAAFKSASSHRRYSPRHSDATAGHRAVYGSGLRHQSRLPSAKKSDHHLEKRHGATMSHTFRKERRNREWSHASDCLRSTLVWHALEILCHKRKENGQQSMESPPPLLDASSLAEHPPHLFWLPLPQESPSRCSKTQSEPGQPCQCLRTNEKLPSQTAQTRSSWSWATLSTRHKGYGHDLIMLSAGWRWSCTTCWRAQHSCWKAYANDGCTSKVPGIETLGWLHIIL